MPVLLAGLDHVAGPNLLDGPALPLHPAQARRDDQSLAERMGVPGGARAGFERDVRAAGPCWLGRIEQRVYAHAARKIFGRAPSGRPGAGSLDIHGTSLMVINIGMA